jgi:hypothetical protein
VGLLVAVFAQGAKILTKSMQTNSMAIALLAWAIPMVIIRNFAAYEYLEGIACHFISTTRGSG